MGEISVTSTSRSSRPIQTTLPPQKLSIKKKTEDWRKDCVDAIVSLSNVTYYNNRTSSYNKQINYNIVNSIFDEKDFLYVTDPLGIGTAYGETPAKMENYNILRNVVEFLKGEELKKQYPFTAVAVNGEAISTKQKLQKEMLKNSLAQLIQNEEAKYGLNQPAQDDQGNPVEPKTPEQIEKYINYEYKDIVEIQTNHILNYLYKKEDLILKFVKGWEHGIISGEEIYYVGIDYNEPYVRVVNPVYFDYDKNPDVDSIEDAQWTREERFMTKGEILDEFRAYLSEEELRQLDEDELGYNSSVSRFDALPGFSYDYDTSNQMNNHNSRRTQYISVNICCWKSWSKIGFLSFTNPDTEELETKIVQEGFKVPAELIDNNIPYTLEWEWINEVWRGIKIGDSTYVNIGPIENQCRESNNMSKCKMPYVGKVYNATNTQSTSLIDLLKKYQYVYNILWYRLELEIAKAQGKKMIVDIAQIPVSKGITLDKFMYYLTNAGIGFINSMEEGKPGDPNSVSKFNQWTSIDMSLSQSIGQYLSIIEKIETSVEKVSGVSRQRLGDTFSSETATGIQNSVIQSTTITEFMFYNHNKVKEKVLNQLVEAAKIAYINNKNINYIGDDLTKVFVEIHGGVINNSDVAIFITNNPQDQMIKAKLEGLFQAALQNDKVQMSDVIKVYKSNSISEVENLIVDSEQKAQQRQQQAQEAENARVQQQIEADKEARLNDNEQRQLDRESSIQEAQIKALSFAKDTDVNMNQIPDVLEQGKLALEQSRFAYDATLKEREMNQKSQSDRMKFDTEKYKADIAYKIAKENKTAAELKHKQSKSKK